MIANSFIILTSGLVSIYCYVYTLYMCPLTLYAKPSKCVLEMKLEQLANLYPKATLANQDAKLRCAFSIRLGHFLAIYLALALLACQLANASYLYLSYISRTTSLEYHNTLLS